MKNCTVHHCDSQRGSANMEGMSPDEPMPQGMPPTWSLSGPTFCLSLSGFPPVRTLLSSGIFPIPSPKPATTPFLPVICADSGRWRSHHPVYAFIRLSLWECCVTTPPPPPPASQWLKTTDAYFSSLKTSCCLVNLDWAYLIQVG